MEPIAVQQLIENGIAGAKVTVTGDGSHFYTTVVSDKFEGLNAVKRQQLVYGTLGDLITRGTIHALSIKTYTPAEWAKAEKLKVS